MSKEASSGKCCSERCQSWGSSFGKIIQPQISNTNETIAQQQSKISQSQPKPDPLRDTTTHSETSINKRVSRVQNYWKSRKEFQHACSISSICDVEDDPRPYAKINVNGQCILGLLDSGASVSILGKNSELFLQSQGIKMKTLNSCIQTADGSNNAVLGYVDLPVNFRNKTAIIKFCVVPTLQSELYLGVDFWRKFNIAPEIVSEIKLDANHENHHELDPTQSSKLSEITKLFPSFTSKGLGKTNLVEHSIDVGNAIPIKQRHYSVSPAIQALIYQEIDRMISLGVIEESCSPWSSPVVLVKKANGKNRLCLDSRKINMVTKKDAYPLPIINGLLGRMQQTKYITSLDLKDAFWQIPLAKTSREITAFTVPGRPLYQFRVMPFGLCNAPQTMCRLMDRVIPHQLHENVFVYLDDLLIVSAEFDEHLVLLKTVAELLSRAGLTLNIEKSHFLLKETRYLGYIIGEHGLRTDSSKVDAIKNFPAPKTVKQTRRLLGMAGWYRRFIPNYADVTAPITNLLRKGVKFHWTEEAELAFENLKYLLCHAPVLHNPDFTKEFFIRCDASTQGIGGVLFQLDDDSEEKPIAFISQKLNSAQRNYTVTELECLAAVICVKQFRPYVEGYRFTIITDHASLKWLMSQKDLNGRLARWSLKLQSFDFTIVHQKGKDNVVADTLSRIYCDNISEINSDAKLHNMNLFDEINTCDEQFEALKKKIEDNPDTCPNFCVRDGKILIRIEPKQNMALTDIPA